MNKTLTPEHVRAFAKHIFRAIAGETIASQAARTALCNFIENHEALREQLAEAQADVRSLSDALQSLYDIQNGPPLYKYEKDWNSAMQNGWEALTRPGVKRVMEEQK